MYKLIQKNQRFFWTWLYKDHHKGTALTTIKTNAIIQQRIQPWYSQQDKGNPDLMCTGTFYFTPDEKKNQHQYACAVHILLVTPKHRVHQQQLCNSESTRFICYRNQKDNLMPTKSMLPSAFCTRCNEGRNTRDNRNQLGIPLPVV